MAPKQITIRNVSPELATRLKALAETTGSSVNATILQLLESALGVDERRKHLKQRYATWTAQDFDEFEESLKAQRSIDESIWE